MTRIGETAPAKLNLALHVRGRLPDGRHALETLFAFCLDGDRVDAEGDPWKGFGRRARALPALG